MKRFENSQQGDRVFDDNFGLPGTITYMHQRYITVVLDDNTKVSYNYDGVWIAHNYPDIKRPSLAYLTPDGDTTSLRPAPVRIVPKYKVPVDTKVYSDRIDNQFKRHYCGPGQPMRCWNDGQTSYSVSNDSDSRRWDKILLGEPITIDGIEYQIGDELG